MEQSLHPNPRGLRGCQALGVDRSATLDPVEVLQSAVFPESQGCDGAVMLQRANPRINARLRFFIEHLFRLRLLGRRQHEGFGPLYS